MSKELTAEEKRLKDHYSGARKWLKWGPYLAERQWGTVREDYSEFGNAWEYFPHDHARSRAYRWGEDGLAGISDDMQRICFAVALWNGKDPILKERLFGLTGNEGNHGEDVKELYYYLDNNPSHSYMKHLYKFPQREYPYRDLVETNRNRTKEDPEYELLDTGIFNENKYFDVFTEYAKNSEEDICIKISVYNRAEEPAYVAVLPTLWFRNLWSFGLSAHKPLIEKAESPGDFGHVKVLHQSLGLYDFYFEQPERYLFTENETNSERLYQQPNASPFVKDAFHTALIGNNYELFTGKKSGTKFSPMYELQVKPGSSVTIRLRLTKDDIPAPFEKEFEDVFRDRLRETDEFYAHISDAKDEDEKNIQRQAFAGMLWSKQYFNIDIPRWLNGDPGQQAPPEARKWGRNHKWQTLNNEDIISMPDKWEYPWYATWDLAFHCVPIGMLDAQFAKDQLVLFLREWYMQPNGQIPAYEWALGDVNPPVHAWSCLQVYKMDKERAGFGDIKFLEKVFHKLLLNFTWWVNRKDHNDSNVFEGGFLGLDNIGVFDRSSAIPGGGVLEQADGTAWMAMFSLNMLEIALEISQVNDAYEDVATKFFEHFVYIADSLNNIGKNRPGSWDEEQGFFYDVLSLPDGQFIPLKVRSLVGLTSLFGVLVIKKELLEQTPDFHLRLKWFRKYRQKNKKYQVVQEIKDNGDILLSIVPHDRLMRIMPALLNENEFLSAGGIRSLSKTHEIPYEIHISDQVLGLNYQPGESTSSIFGGNSNWRGPIWMPMNYLLILSLKKYGEYYQDDAKVAFPSGSDNLMTLEEVSFQLASRLISIFKKDSSGTRPVHAQALRYQNDPNFKELILFYEYFHGDNCRGVGASHQTGWTGVIAEIINRVNSQLRK